MQSWNFKNIIITEDLKDAISEITYQIQSNALGNKLNKNDILALNDNFEHLKLSNTDWQYLFFQVQKAIKIANKKKLNEKEEAFLKKMMLTCLVLFFFYFIFIVT